MPTIIREAGAMQKTSAALRAARKRIAVVPTMGALHEGHLMLIRRACDLADSVIATIFVNPIQFGPREDFARYPRPFERDVEEAGKAGAEFIFAPSITEMYPPDFQTAVTVERVTSVLEGAARPGHFRGVTTVVAKLFNIVQPHVALFGQKDGQQVVVIRRMARDLNFPVDLVVVPTVREPDGLAMSSRNVYLNPAQRGEAPVLYRALGLAARLIERGERSSRTIRDRMQAEIAGASSGSIDYISVADAVTLEEQDQLHDGQELMISLAVRFGTTRLIDNMTLNVPSLS